MASDLFKGCSNLAEIIVPNSVKSIGAGAFESCTNLASVTLPTAIKEIGSKAFDKCTNLKRLKLMGAAPPKISGNSFTKPTYREAVVNVPKGALGNFQINKQWCKFLDIIEK